MVTISSPMISVHELINDGLYYIPINYIVFAVRKTDLFILKL